MSKALYLGAWGAEVDEEAVWTWTRWRLALDTRWPLDYIDSLSLEDVQGYLTVLDVNKELRG